jgi:hypothetical protein
LAAEVVAAASVVLVAVEVLAAVAQAAVGKSLEQMIDREKADG